MINYFRLDNSFGFTNGKVSNDAIKISKREYDKAINNIDSEANNFVNNEHKKMSRVRELQNKAILEGLTDAEKEEYKKLTSN